VNRAFHSLAIPRLYSHANIRALVTLLRNPAYVAYVRTVSLRWTPEGDEPINGGEDALSDWSDEEDDKDEDEDDSVCALHHSVRLLYFADLFYGRSDGDDRKTFPLRRCNKTALAVVLLNMLPSLHQLFIPCAELGDALWDVFPRRTPRPNRRDVLPLGLQHVRSLQVSLSSTTDFPLSILVRFFLLPNVTSLDIRWLDDSELSAPWLDNDLGLGHLHQTSGVTHLSIESTSDVEYKLLSLFLQLPRALCNLEYSVLSTYGGILDLNSLSLALRHVAGTLRHLSIPHDAVTGSLTGLPNLRKLCTISLSVAVLSHELLDIPRLVSLTVELSYLSRGVRQRELASVLAVLMCSDVAKLTLIGSQLEATQVPSEMHDLCKSKGVVLEFVREDEPWDCLRTRMSLKMPDTKETSNGAPAADPVE
jgi:hypothetical protein